MRLPASPVSLAAVTFATEAHRTRRRVSCLFSRFVLPPGLTARALVLASFRKLHDGAGTAAFTSRANTGTLPSSHHPGREHIRTSKRCPPPSTSATALPLTHGSRVMLHSHRRLAREQGPARWRKEAKGKNPAAACGRRRGRAQVERSRREGGAAEPQGRASTSRTHQKAREMRASAATCQAAPSRELSSELSMAAVLCSFI